MVISVISGVISGVPKYRKDPERRKKRGKKQKDAKRPGKAQKDAESRKKTAKRPRKLAKDPLKGIILWFHYQEIAYRCIPGLL